MSGLTWTLLADGTSDRTLMPVIDWCLRDRGVRVERARWADPRVLPRRATSLPDRIAAALDLFACDVLFVHRDAEARPHAERRAEIAEAVRTSGAPVVPVVPVRMTEAWLLHDEAAIRQASGNPNGTTPLQLPAPSRVESVGDPKAKLFEALVNATELSGRRRKRAQQGVHAMRHRVAELIDDYAALRRVPAFIELLDCIDATCAPWIAS